MVGIGAGETSYFDAFSLDYEIVKVPRPVGLDVKPGSDPNCFNANGHGVIPIAILGESGFDVSTVDQGTLDFSGLAVRVKRNGSQQCAIENVNEDGFWDLVCQFEDSPDTWSPGEGEATLNGELYDGSDFRGKDSICIVPRNSRKYSKSHSRKNSES